PIDDEFLRKCFIEHLRTSQTDTPKLEDFLYYVQNASNNRILSCHRTSIHKMFFTQIRIIASLHEQTPDIRKLYETISISFDKKYLKKIAQNQIYDNLIIYFQPPIAIVFEFAIETYLNNILDTKYLDITRREEDEADNNNGGFRWELNSCDDSNQLYEFERVVNEMIKDRRKSILKLSIKDRKQKIFDKWIEIEKACDLFQLTYLTSYNKEFIVKDIFDPFYCMTIDLVKDYNLWSYILGQNLQQIKDKSKGLFNFITPEDIVEINLAAKNYFDNFDPQNISFESSPDQDISIEYSLPHIDISLKGSYSNSTITSINEILQSCPEHPTYCSYERKSHFFESPFEDREIFDPQIFNQYSLESGQSSSELNINDEIQDTIIINNQKPKAYKRYSKNGMSTVVVKDLKTPEKYEKGVITSKKKYRKKVDVAISYRVIKGTNEIGEQFGYFYPLLGEVKLPGINGEDDYKKNVRALNDNFNTIIKHYSKKATRISNKLQSLFDDIKLGGIHASDPEMGQMINLLYCIKQAVRKFIKDMKDIEKEIEKINQSSDEFIEESDKPGKFLKNNILSIPSSPK
ncbi:13536_t:CDS:2, partial [Racocetra persica]